MTMALPAYPITLSVDFPDRDLGGRGTTLRRRRDKRDLFGDQPAIVIEKVAPAARNLHEPETREVSGYGDQHNRRAVIADRAVNLALA
jgi:hypothetical protein